MPHAGQVEEVFSSPTNTISILRAASLYLSKLNICRTSTGAFAGYAGAHNLF